MLKKVFVLFIFTLYFHFFSVITLAQGACDFLPCGDNGVLPAPNNSEATGLSFFRFGVGLIFSIFIAIGIFVIIKSSLEIIRSEGDNEKIENASKSIRGVFIGIAILLMGIIGIVILISFFSDASFLQKPVPTPDGVRLPF